MAKKPVAKVTAPEVSEEEIATFLAIEKKRLKAQREAGDFEKQNKKTKEKLKAFVEARGGSDRTTTHYGYVLSLIEKAGTVPWKEEFILVAGQEKAEQLVSSCPPKFSLVVEAEA